MARSRYNFWNAFDPITEFSALDEFKLYELSRRSGPAGAPVYHLQPSPANPIDIRITGVSTPWGGHTSYFGNLPDVQIPLAFRILGDRTRPEWQPRQPLPPPLGIEYVTFLSLISLPILAMILLLVVKLGEYSNRLARALLLSDTVTTAQAWLARAGIPQEILALWIDTISLPVLAGTIWLVLLVLLAGVVLTTRLVAVRLMSLVEASAPRLALESGNARRVTIARVPVETPATDL
jgi:hypothetical protein